MKPGKSYVPVGEVVPNLFVGCKPPEGTALRDLGFSLLVLCAEEHQPSAGAFPGVEVLRPKLKDDGSESAAEVLRGALPHARAVASALARGKKVLVTCQWGYNRSGVVAGLALRMRGYSPTQVLAALRKARPAHQGLEALGSPEYREAMVRAPL
jgi:hypothetical protein